MEYFCPLSGALTYSTFQQITMRYLTNEAMREQSCTAPRKPYPWMLVEQQGIEYLFTVVRNDVGEWTRSGPIHVASTPIAQEILRKCKSSAHQHVLVR